MAQNLSWLIWATRGAAKQLGYKKQIKQATTAQLSQIGISK